LLIAAVLVAALAFAAGTGVAAAAEPSLDCIGSGGGPAYEPGSGLTVYENHTDGTVDTFYFPDSETVRFAYDTDGLNLSAPGESAARLENGTGPTTCLADVDASTNDVIITPDDDASVVLESNVTELAFRDPDYDDDSAVDLAYDHDDTVTIQFDSTGLDAGQTVVADDTDSGTELASATVSGTGSLTLTLSSGTHDVTLATESDGGGGNNGGGGGSGGDGAPESSGDESDAEVTVENAPGDSEGTGPDTDGDSGGDGGTGESAQPGLTVSVSNPQPGQTIVLTGDGEAFVRGGEGGGSESDGGDDDASDDTTDSDQNTGESAADGADGETSAPSSTVRADRLAVEVDTTRDFELSVTTYENDLTPSATLAGESGGGETSTRLVGPPLGVVPLTRGGPLFKLATVRAQQEPQEQGLAPKEVQAAAESFEDQTGTVSAGYVQVEHNLAPEEIAGATFEFSIRRAYLDNLGVEPTEVVLYHQTEDGWTTRETAYVGSDDTYHRFNGTMPSFSTFALGTEADLVAVTDATIAERMVTVSEEATITATVENRGQAATETTVSLTRPEETISTQTVSLDGNETVTVSFNFAAEEPGEYNLAVDNVDLSSLTVEASDETQTGDTSEEVTADTDAPAAGEPTADDGESDESSTPWAVLGTGLALIVVLLAMIVWILRKDNSDKSNG
jgi:hypothetical protein